MSDRPATELEAYVSGLIAASLNRLESTKVAIVHHDNNGIVTGALTIDVAGRQALVTVRELDEWDG